MKTPNKIIIDLEKGKVILETDMSVIVADEISELIYCQNTNDENISLSISMNIPFDKTIKEGVNISEIEDAKEDAIMNMARRIQTDNGEDESAFDQKKIESMFKEMVRLPGDDSIAIDFISYNIEGYEIDIFEFKKDLFKSAMKDPKITGDKREWLKKNKIRLFNSKKKLNI